MKLRAAITKVDMGDQWPWDFTVDYCIPGTDIRNTQVDSFDYGRVATHAEAVEAVCQVMRRAQQE